jgi:hypothetical protein
MAILSLLPQLHAVSTWCVPLTKLTHCATFACDFELHFSLMIYKLDQDAVDPSLLHRTSSRTFSPSSTTKPTFGLTASVQAYSTAHINHQQSYYSQF